MNNSNNDTLLQQERSRQQVYNLLTPEFSCINVIKAVSEYESNCKEWNETPDYKLETIMTYL